MIDSARRGTTRLLIFMVTRAFARKKCVFLDVPISSLTLQLLKLSEQGALYDGNDELLHLKTRLGESLSYFINMRTIK